MQKGLEKRKNRIMKGLLLSMRPAQWIKNLFLFPALIFAERIFHIQDLLLNIAAFILFCLLSSAGYIFNDLLDADADSQHPEKRNRPIPSGAVPRSLALSMMLFFILLGTGGGLFINLPFFLSAAGYILLSVLYTLIFKHLVIIDVMAIAAGFVVRAVAGGLSIEVPISPWFLICTAFLALYLGINKRLAEMRLLNDRAINHRRNLEHYSEELLKGMKNIVTASAIISYTIYTFLSDKSQYLMLTVPYVIYGIFRYEYLVERRNGGGAPETTLLKDIPMQATLILWAVSALLILHLG